MLILLITSGFLNEVVVEIFCIWVSNGVANRPITVILEEVPAGAGVTDIRAYVREVNRLPQVVPMMMEHLSNEEEYDKAAAHIRKCAAAEGIDI